MDRSTLILFGSPLNIFQPILCASELSVAAGGQSHHNRRLAGARRSRKRIEERFLQQAINEVVGRNKSGDEFLAGFYQR